MDIVFKNVRHVIDGDMSHVEAMALRCSLAESVPIFSADLVRHVR